MSPVRVRQEAPEEKAMFHRTLPFLFVPYYTLFLYSHAVVFFLCFWASLSQKHSIHAKKSIKHNDFLKFDYLKKMSHCGILLISFGNLYLFFQSPAHRSKGRCSLLLIAADRCFVMVLRRTGQSTGLCAVVSGSGSFHVVRSAAGRFFKTPAAV